MVVMEFNTKVKAIKTDNGSKFTLTKFYTDNGILHQTNCVENLQQNRIVKRKH